MRRTLVAVVGATATGKTAVSEAVAARLGGEVVCADARQVFRELEIGTGRPSPAERAARPHHLFDLWGLGEKATAGSWARAASVVCEDLFARGVTPVLVGGSGLYLAALQQGLHPEPPKDAAVRASLVTECDALGSEAMHARLAALDPAAAARLAPRDRQRILRALEIVIVGGRPLATWREAPREAPLVAEWRSFELVCEPATLGRRIEERTRAMWAAGLLEETRALVASGHGESLTSLAAIGYDEAMALLAGTLDAATAEARMNERTRQMAKRQRTWFRHQMSAEVLSAESPEAFDALAERIVRDVGGGGARG